MRAIAIALLMICSLSAVASPRAASVQPSVHLEASVSREVAEDTAHTVLFVEKEHANAMTAQQEVSKVLSDALAKTKKLALVSVKTGRTSTYAVYDKDRRIAGWRVRGKLVLESKNVAAMSQCVTELTKTMSIENMWFSLSVTAQRKVQDALQGEAIATFKAKALKAAQQFGYKRYALSDVRIAAGSQGGVRMHAAMAERTAKTSMEAVPVEAGKVTVTATVSGTVKLQ